MNKSGNGGSIFPRQESPGLSMRDYFAGQVLASISGAAIGRDDGPVDIAVTCYLIADAMMEASKR